MVIGFCRPLALKDKSITFAEDDVIAILAERGKSIALVWCVREIVDYRHRHPIVEGSRSHLALSSRSRFPLRIKSRYDLNVRDHRVFRSCRLQSVSIELRQYYSDIV